MVRIRRCRQLVWASLLLSGAVLAQERDWSLGAYAGTYYDTEPAGFLEGRGNFLPHHMVALTGSKTVWRSDSMPLSLEIDAMVGVQNGMASLGEFAIAPALRWHGFPWNNTLKTSVSIAPLGLSTTTSVSPLELGSQGQGSRTLNWLFMEVAVSRPSAPDTELFARLHHRCAIYDLLNNYGANGEDFFTLGFRKRF